MIIKDEKLAKIKKLLVENGLLDDLTEEFDYYLKTKSTSRFVYLLKWLRQNKIECNEWTLSSIYKIDVVIRRMISEILKPIELKVKTHISFLLEEESISVKALKSGIAFENLSELSDSLFEKKINTTNFVIRTIGNLQKKFKGNLDEIINELMFGQVSALVSLFKIDLIEKLFGSSEKTKIVDSLEYVVSLRNHIAHHNIIFSIKDLYINNKKISIKNVIESLHFIAEGDFNRKLLDNIERYRDNLMNKHHSDDEEKQQLLTDIFNKVIDHLL